MKLIGYTEVFDYGRNNYVSRSKHTTITIGDEKSVTMLLVQQPSHKSGLKYKVTQNIARLFTKFLKEGKATIRLKEPQHELRLVNEAIQLKSFLTLLYNCCRAPGPLLPALPANPKFKRAPSKTAVINSLKDYGQLDKLSLKVANLRVSNVPIKDLPLSVSRLKELATLEVDKTDLNKFPKFLGKFPFLTSLVLTNNNLQSNENWDFLSSPTLQQQLQLLDIRHNKLTILPARICALQQLVTLRVDYNWLLTLPHTIPNLKKLRCFSASNNKIVTFPSTLFDLKHILFDISDNPNHFPPDGSCQVSCNIQLKSENIIREAYYTELHSLKELASRVIVNKRVPYKKFGLPRCLEHHLDVAKTCQQCGKSCFNQYFLVFGCADVKDFFPELIYTQMIVTTHFFVCSSQCVLLSYPKLNRNSRASVSFITN